MPITLNGTTGVTFPSWTTATRPASPTAGQTGFNTTTSQMETYDGTSWTVAVNPTSQGTSGQYLQSAGAGAAPTWATLSSSGALIRAPQILTSGTSYTTPSNCTSIYVEAVGGGGGGGGSGSANAGGGGGGSGAYCASYFTVTASTAYTYAIGAGGSGGGSSSAGSTGGNTTFTVGATTITAGGGNGGAHSGGIGGSGGTATSGTINAPGAPGFLGVVSSGSGSGGNSFFAGGAICRNSNSSGANGTLGSGGSGGYKTTSNTSGGNGGDGIIRIWEFT